MAALLLTACGAADLLWGQVVPTASLATMLASYYPNLVIGPNGNNYTVANPVIAVNLQSPNDGGALRQLDVRVALGYAFNKHADDLIYGGPAVSGVLNEVVPSGSAGYISGYDPYPTANDEGHPVKAESYLTKAGFSPGQITLNLVHLTASVHLKIAQADQAALQAAGFKVNLIPVTPPNAIYTSYLESPTASQTGACGIAETEWTLDWLGNNGRSVIEPLFDGRTYGPNSRDYGDHDNANVNSDIDRALTSSTSVQSATYWQAAPQTGHERRRDRPIGAQKQAVYHSTRVQACQFLIREREL
jgi:peptide/nickel transport system substrate-binding protein